MISYPNHSWPHTFSDLDVLTLWDNDGVIKAWSVWFDGFYGVQ